MSWLGLAGRRAVVTGGASGIGRNTALHFIKEGCETVTIVDRDSAAVQAAIDEMVADIRKDPELASAASRLSGHACDVTSGDQVRATWKEIGESDILCNCAGITKDGWLTRMEESVWDDVMNVNLKGTFLMTQGFVIARAGGLEGLKNVTQSSSNGPGGSIINIGSIVGKMGNMGQANYTASKSGVVGFTKTAAKELAAFNVRINVNCILPGSIATPMANAVPEKVMEKVVATIPMGRVGDPNEIANTALFLASDRSSYMTGNAIEVAGGLGM